MTRLVPGCHARCTASVRSQPPRPAADDIPAPDRNSGSRSLRRCAPARSIPQSPRLRARSRARRLGRSMAAPPLRRHSTSVDRSSGNRSPTSRYSCGGETGGTGWPTSRRRVTPVDAMPAPGAAGTAPSSRDTSPPRRPGRSRRQHRSPALAEPDRHGTGAGARCPRMIDLITILEKLRASRRRAGRAARCRARFARAGTHGIPGVVPEIVPEPIRSPGWRLQPLLPW